MLLYIIRHGDPDYANDTLTEKGKKQAYALAKRLSVNGLDKVYSSPLGRAQDTARPTCELLGLSYEIEEWTNEKLAWEEFAISSPERGRNWAFHCQATQFMGEENAVRQDWYNIEAFTKCPQGREGYSRISDASDEFLERHGYKREKGLYRILSPSDERIAVFCHQGFGTTWLSHLLSVPPQIFWAGFDITHSGVTILYFPNNEDGYTLPKCLCLSDTSHCYKEALSMKYHNVLDI